MSLDVTAADATLKEIYPNGVIDSVNQKGSRFWNLLKKGKGTLKQTPFGAGFIKPTKYGNPQAGSATYATGYAQASSESSKYSAWQLTPGEMFQFARISGSAIRRMKSTGAFVEAIVSEIENTKLAAQRMLELYLARDGYASLGQISSSSTVNTAVITLAKKSQVRFFDKGMSLVASASNAANTLRSATALKVSGKDPSAGTITLSAAANTQSMAAGDFLFRDGDRQNSGTPSRIVPVGMGGWFPAVKPSSSENFFGIDRSVDNRFYGIIHDATKSGNLEEAIFDISAQIDGACTHAVMGPETFNKLVKSVANKTWIDIEMDEPTLGFSALRIQGASGEILCFGDTAFAEGEIRVFDIDGVEYLHTGDAPVMLEQTDGLTIRNVAGTDDWQATVVVSGQFSADNPGNGGVIINA